MSQINEYEQFKTALKHLIDRYDPVQHNALDYNEESVKTEFINKLFILLGWDVNNDTGTAQKYKDVELEYRLTTPQGTKAPDYAFRIGGNVVFFVEAKSPHHNISENKQHAYQIKKYAWNAKIPISILTDFEEFAIYDCQKNPKSTDNAAIGRIKYLKYTEYVKHADILWKFSKYSVLRGDFDKFIASSKLQGTENVDTKFLKTIKNWRINLAKNIAKNNPHFTLEELNYCVQKTIIRILFLRICEDRHIEPESQLQKIADEKNIYNHLVECFKNSSVKYNSGIFDFVNDVLIEQIVIDDKILNAMINDLYFPNSSYDFSIISIEILGNVYEEFLGETINLTNARRVKVEQKPDIKIIGGVYYTPEYVVEYIIKNTLDILLVDKKPKDVKKIKILDISCGSGTFLVRAYQHLLDYYLDYYSKNPQKHNDKIYQISHHNVPVYALTIAIKKQILLDNIYGLDIDPQAIEITKLSLLLKVLENETSETLSTPTSRIYSPRALPNLNDNIKNGNAIINSSYYAQNTLDSTTSHSIHDDIHSFNWNNFTPKKFHIIVGNPPYLKEDKDKNKFHQVKQSDMGIHYKSKMDYWYFFTAKAIDLLEEDGYHSFIAPNNWCTNDGASKLRSYIFDNSNLISYIDFNEFSVFANASIQTMIYVIQKTHEPVHNYNISHTKILNKSIRPFSLINYLITDETVQNEHIKTQISNLFSISNNFADGFTLESSSIIKILDIIFRHGTSRLEKTLIQSGIDISQENVSKKNASILSKKYTTMQNYKHKYGIVKLKSKHPDYNLTKNDCKTNRGVFVLTKDEYTALKISPNEKKYVVPFYYPKNMHPYATDINNHSYIIYIDHILNQSMKKHHDLLPNIRMHLDKFNSIITSERKPYGLNRPRSPDLFDGEKITSVRKTMKPNFTYVTSQSYLGRGFSTIQETGDRAKYLIGLFNSKLSHFIFYMSGKKQGEQLQIDVSSLEKFPLVPIDKTNNHLYHKIIDDVNTIITLKKQIFDLDQNIPYNSTLNELRSYIDALINSIDNSVFKLYKLNDDQIHTIKSLI